MLDKTVELDSTDSKFENKLQILYNFTKAYLTGDIFNVTKIKDVGRYFNK